MYSEVRNIESGHILRPNVPIIKCETRFPLNLDTYLDILSRLERNFELTFQEQDILRDKVS
jgi:hypothetical protein